VAGAILEYIPISYELDLNCLSRIKDGDHIKVDENEKVIKT